MRIITLTSKGQLTLPAEVRQRLNLKNHDKLRVTERDGKIILEKEDYWAEFEAKQQWIRARLQEKAVPPVTPEDLERLRAQRGKERYEQYHHQSHE